MRKLMLLAAMLAMVLVAAAPALGQAIVASDDDQTQYQNIDCDQVQAAFAAQYGGDANAAADEGEATAEVANELGVSQDAVLNCLGVQAGEDADVDADQAGGDIGDVGVDDDADGVVDEAGEAAAAASAAAAAGGGAAGGGAAAAGGGAAAGTTTLPDTGGASLFTLGAGALLVGGGLLARRIFR